MKIKFFDFQAKISWKFPKRDASIGSKSLFISAFENRRVIELAFSCVFEYSITEEFQHPVLKIEIYSEISLLLSLAKGISVVVLFKKVYVKTNAKF